jgi:8-oxo-dGTP pyrophosphatase MutT (NUDIX family)
VFGAPPEAQHVRYQKYYAKKLNVPTADTLEGTIDLALAMLGSGEYRSYGEREVPLYIWRTPHFQNWYRALRSAGNRLDGARVEWTFRVGPEKKFVLFWALRANVFIASEGRNKTNEVMLSRPDIATIVMYCPAERFENTEVVLIREFRTPVSNHSGFVYEIPGGSTFKPAGDPLKIASDECAEETGLRIEPDRICMHNARQLVATISAHKAHLFSVVLTPDEIKKLRSQKGVAHGVSEDTERTYVEVRTVSEILGCQLVDWSMLGMILSVLNQNRP